MKESIFLLFESFFFFLLIELKFSVFPCKHTNGSLKTVANICVAICYELNVCVPTIIIC